MRPGQRLSFELRVDELDAALLRWASQDGAQFSSIEDAGAGAPGFTLETLMRRGFGQEFGAPPSYGRLSSALYQFGYWLFVNFGDPLVAHPRGFWVKCVNIVRAEGDVTYDGRRMLISARTNADPVLIPVPAVPAELLPDADPYGFARSRDALITYATAIVDRVNLISAPALALSSAVADGYSTGEIET